MKSIEIVNGTKFLIIEINLKKVSKENTFFFLMKQEFDLPNYFRDSFDSLDECMRDLKWLRENNIKVMVNNIASIKEKDSKLYDKIYKSFLFYKEYWDGKNSNKNPMNVYFENI